MFHDFVIVSLIIIDLACMKKILVG